MHKPCLLTTRELRSDYAATAPVQVDPSPKLGASTAEPPRAWAESVGAWIAATTSTSVVALRIGYFAEQRPDAEAVSPQELSASAARPYQSDRERGAGQGVDLHRHGDSGHPAAGQRQRLPQQQPPVGRGLTQRPKIAASSELTRPR